MRRKFIEARSGQVIVLGALGVLLVALMMLLTLNVGKAVYEKIRIQQLADASAFSTATLAARTYNFYAYTNRANIAGLVAGASMHGFMSLASTVPSMFMAAKDNFYYIGGIEVLICIATRNPRHCRHAIRDFRIARRYGNAGRRLANAVQRLDDKFVDAIEALDTHMKFIAAQQTGTKMWMSGKLLSNSVTDGLRKDFSENSTAIRMAGYINVGKYHAAIDDVGNDAELKRKWLGTEIANGSRWKRFVYRRKLFPEVFLGVHPETLMDLIYRVPGASNGFSMPVSHDGESRIVKGATGVEHKISLRINGPDGDAIAAADKGRVFSMTWNCPLLWISSYKASLGSGKNGGEHKCRGARCCTNESKHKFTCLADENIAHNCFTIFKANDNPDEDFGQPSLFAAFSSDLRRTRGGAGGKEPWEVTDNDSGKVRVDFGDVHNLVPYEGHGREVQLSDNPAEFGEGLAISKALVYYHHPNWKDKSSGWKESPNFFNPYWKAKLQPFRDSDRAIILTILGGGDYAGVIMAPGTPLP